MGEKSKLLSFIAIIALGFLTLGVGAKYQTKQFENRDHIYNSVYEVRTIEEPESQRAAFFSKYLQNQGKMYAAFGKKEAIFFATNDKFPVNARRLLEGDAVGGYIMKFNYDMKENRFTLKTQNAGQYPSNIYNMKDQKISGNLDNFKVGDGPTFEFKKISK